MRLESYFEGSRFFSRNWISYRIEPMYDEPISDDLSLIVPPWQRIDLSSMSSTMSTLDPMALSSHCNRHFDVFFKTKPFYCSGGNILRFESLLKYLNMEWEPGNHLYKDKVSKEFKKP